MKTGKLVETESGLENVQDLGACVRKRRVRCVECCFSVCVVRSINKGDVYPLFISFFFVFVFLRIINTVEIIFRS